MADHALKVDRCSSYAVTLITQRISVNVTSELIGLLASRRGSNEADRGPGKAEAHQDAGREHGAGPGGHRAQVHGDGPGGGPVGAVAEHAPGPGLPLRGALMPRTCLLPVCPGRVPSSKAPFPGMLPLRTRKLLRVAD